ncbi:ABC transporter permease [Spirosoma utsteinense]|uniref:ABC transport system permease protein n=1 Tax=Spirosoma utsteinense TaxID=2585773 RepID=A0ABR6WDI7_9BACT|nr:ABC transporter permease [Spirosoma utsteinense]MBC3786953.1 putative ABC transport system permease protein [Spirosoma utsteinense]MBC3794065.1 putative ABC transport system permease protein [Spirosoma utsteinense]
MLRNYFKIAFRNLAKHKGFSFINITGVAIGLTCFLLISLYVQDELSYDCYNTHADRTYRLTRTFLSTEGTASLRLAQAAPPFGPLIKQDFPEAEQVVRTIDNGGLLRYGEHSFNEEDIFFAEANLFKVFDINVTSGNPEHALVNPFSILFSQPMAEKYFGQENPVGKTVRLYDQFDMTVTGVFEPLPAQSHFHPSFLLSFSTFNDPRVYGAEQLRTSWSNNSFNTYVLLKSGDPGSPQRMEAAFPGFQDKYVPAEEGRKASSFSVLNLQKLTDIHLKSHTDSEVEPTGDMSYIYLFSAIGLFILLIACINYMNLATARSAGRAKEVGMRKVVGALRSQLIGQFLSESILLVTFALGIAIVLLILCLPVLNTFTQKQLSFQQLLDPVFLSILVGITLLTGLVAGSYPAFFLTSFRPLGVLKGQIASTMRTGKLRQVLVITQFAIAIALIISTAVVYNQMKYIQNYRLGYAKDQVLLMPDIGDSTTNYETLKQQLVQTGMVRDMGRSSRVPSGRLLDSYGGMALKGDSMAPVKINLRGLRVDHDFIPAYQIQMAAGRNFSRAYTTDTSMIVLNETAARQLGWTPEQAIGKPFQYGPVKGQIIGVTKDYHFESLHQPVAALAMILVPDQLNWLSIPLKGSTPAAIRQVESVWKRFFPQRPFDYQFLDTRFDRLYAREQTQQTLFTIFASVAILISCLGLFGLSMFMAEQRTKEIGIRKVLGASELSLVALFSQDFMKLVLVALLIASPVAWYAMHTWLSDFAYRTDIHWWVFLLAGGLTVGIALLTVSFQSVKAALMNPVKSLRSE